MEQKNLQGTITEAMMRITTSMECHHHLTMNCHFSTFLLQFSQGLKIKWFHSQTFNGPTTSWIKVQYSTMNISLGTCPLWLHKTWVTSLKMSCLSLGITIIYALIRCTIAIILLIYSANKIEIWKSHIILIYF
jgi:hypothetical protein